MFILFLILCAHRVIAAPQVLDKVAAVVENSIVLESNVNSMLSTVKRDAQKANQQLPNDGTLRQQIIEQLIMDTIILQLAQRANIIISEEQLNKAIDNILAKNNITFDQLRSRLAYNDIDYNTYRAQIQKEMLIAEVRNGEVRRRVIILPSEVDSLMQQISDQISNGVEFNLSHILIPLPENPYQDQLDKAEALANSLIEQSKRGANFDKLAITYSADNQIIKSGQMGWEKFEELPSLFSTRLKGIQKASIVGPIRSGIGFHILKVNDIRGSDEKVLVTEMHARHILLRPSIVLTDQQARAKLKDILLKIKSHQLSFSATAKHLSEDPGSANQGGDLGWSSADKFDPPFRDTLMHLKKGEISMPIHSSFGWHLIQLIDTRQVDRTEEAKKDRAYRLLFNRKFAEEAQTWMQEQRASAYVKIIDNKNG